MQMHGAPRGAAPSLPIREGWRCHCWRCGGDDVNRPECCRSTSLRWGRIEAVSLRGGGHRWGASWIGSRAHRCAAGRCAGGVDLMHVNAPKRPWSAQAAPRRPVPASAGARRKSPLPRELDGDDETQREMTEAIEQEVAAVPRRPWTAGARRRPPSALMRRATLKTPKWVDRLSRRGNVVAPPRPRPVNPPMSRATATRARIRALSRNKMLGGALPPYQALPPLEMPQPPPKRTANHARLVMLSQKQDKNAVAREYFAKVRASHPI